MQRGRRDAAGRHRWPAALVVPATLALAACSAARAVDVPGGNGEALRDGHQVLLDARDELGRAGTAHVTMQTTTGDGATVSVDVQVSRDQASGSMALDGRSARLLFDGTRLFLDGAADFWRAEGATAADAAALEGRWVVAPRRLAGGIGDLTLSALPDRLADADRIHDAVRAEVRAGGPVVVVTGSDGGSVEVAATGSPFPLRAVRPGAQPETITLSGFDQPMPAVTAPADPLDVSQLAGG